MYIRKEPKFIKTVAYMDEKVKEYIDTKCTFRNITFTQCEELIKKLRNNHSDEQLYLLRDSLEIENEMNKQTGLLQSMLNIISTVLLGMTVTIFTFFTANFQIIFNLFGKATLDLTPDKDKVKTINEIQKMLTDSVNISLDQVLGKLFIGLLIGVIGMCYFVNKAHNQISRKALFYHKIIERSIELQVPRQVNEEN
ncbi:hypothetical protein AB1283_04140 [Bacillus sp. S13(2024)]|uniref:hypothetical protein n=1 Tax=unclassified Bacillus (in: firmicutes) TaxID=185979 RepID=UPI003D20D69D